MEAAFRAVTVLVLVPLLAAAQTPGEAPAEVKHRFERAIELFNRGDAPAAVTEFEQVAAVYPRPGILFNLGLVYAVVGDDVRAVEVLDRLLAAPGTLSPERLAKAKAVRETSAAKLGELEVVVPVDGAAVEVDSHAIGASPLPGPVKVKAGRVLVGAIAPKYAPGHVEAVIPAGGRAEVRLELAPLERPLAQLRLRSSTPDADVYIDGQRVGRTPLVATLPVAPGERRVELRREGFTPWSTTVTLGEGALGELSQDLEEDPVALAREGGQLALPLIETESVVRVDGKLRGAYLGPLSLVPGPHRVRVERAGFYPQTLDVVVSAGQRTDATVTFDPTPELRAELGSSARTHRLLGIAGLAVGGVGLASGAGYLVYNLNASAEIQRQVDGWSAKLDTTNGKKVDPSCVGDVCQNGLRDANDRLAQAQSFRWAGYLLLGVGAAAAAIGVVSLVTSPDVSQYDRAPDSALAPWTSLELHLGVGQVAVFGRF